VDELGGLDDAIAFAAEKAGLGANYRLQEYPRQKELMEAIQELIERAGGHRSVRAPGIAAQIAERIEGELKTLRALNDPQGLYARLPYSLQIR
jgi:protease IV